MLATLLKGIQSDNLDWNYIMVGCIYRIMIELCGIKALAGISFTCRTTTLPIFIGGAIKGITDGQVPSATREVELVDDDLGRGSLFATGLIAGGAIAGVIVAFINQRQYFESMKLVSFNIL